MQGKKLFETKGKSPSLTIRIRPETRDKLAEIAAKERIGLGDLMRALIDPFLDDPKGVVEAIRKRQEGYAALKVMDSGPPRKRGRPRKS